RYMDRNNCFRDLRFWSENKIPMLTLIQLEASDGLVWRQGIWRVLGEPKIQANADSAIFDGSVSSIFDDWSDEPAYHGAILGPNSLNDEFARCDVGPLSRALSFIGSE